MEQKQARAKAGGARTSRAAPASGLGSSTVTSDEVVYQMTRAIHNISKQQESFKKAVDQWHDIEKEIELRITATKKRMDDQESMRNKEMQELEGEVERQRKRKRIDMEQDIREFGMDQVKKLLAERKQISIAADEYEQLKKEVEILRKQKDDAVAQAVHECLDKAKAELSSRTESLQLRHSAELAGVNARADQGKNQIKVLEDTIGALRNELDRQRELTREIAYAQSSRPNPYSGPPPSAGNSNSSR